MKYLMLLPCLIFFGIGLPMAMGKVPPNSTMGYRTGRTLSDEAVWYAVNTNVGWSLVLGSLISAALIWWIFALDLHLTVKSLLSTALLIVPAVLAVIVGAMS